MSLMGFSGYLACAAAFKPKPVVKTRAPSRARRVRRKLKVMGFPPEFFGTIPRCVEDWGDLPWVIFIRLSLSLTDACIMRRSFFGEINECSLTVAPDVLG
jgi:hypothetical protein